MTLLEERQPPALVELDAVDTLGLYEVRYRAESGGWFEDGVRLVNLSKAYEGVRYCC